MANSLLNTVVFIKDPSILPESSRHHDIIDSLSRSNSLVLLLSHGNEYNIPDDYALPSNVHIIEYDLTMDSIQEATQQIQILLQRHGVGLRSRHLDNGDALPIVLSGAVLTTSGTALHFVNNEVDFNKLKQTNKAESNTAESDWNVFNE